LNLPIHHDNPEAAYQHSLQEGLLPDPAQAMAVHALQELHQQFAAWQSNREGWRTRLRARIGLDTGRPVRGLYFWGGVGRGKTWLMDMFYRTLPGERKMRMHFHRFMQMVHQQLREAKGVRNPLEQVASSIACRADIICFDEFFVSDIGDAMILGNLLDALFARQVLLVATSNLPPDQLYENGLQRQNFLPAIALLKQHTRVINVDGGIDYRLRSLDKTPVYHWPLDARAQTALATLFDELTLGVETRDAEQLQVNDREFTARKWSESVAWFDFSVLCCGPRGAADYIELAREYHTIFISGLPRLDQARDDEARRFITLVDEFYDHQVKVVISAEVPVEQLYQGGILAFPMERTVSRLLEMQTREYLVKPHTP
jgi:cell division protein ZapE